MKSYRLKDIREGLSESFCVTITSQMLEAFVVLSGDQNPLHTDPSFAAVYKYPDRVVHGMLTASFLSRLVGMYLPGKFALFQEVSLSFTAPVYPGDTLNVTGEVVSIHEVYRQIEIKASITNQHGEKVSRAKIRTGINE
jgi:3-hydroxybutyryl-CoA dehydratase